MLKEFFLSSRENIKVPLSDFYNQEKNSNQVDRERKSIQKSLRLRNVYV